MNRPALPFRIMRAGLVAALALAGAACSDSTLPELSGDLDLAQPWQTVSPGTVGLDAARLEAAAEAASSLDRVRSLLVVRRGRLAFERYFGDARAGTPADVRSVTKSLVSTLVGIAIDRGYLASVDAPIAPFLETEYPGYAPDPPVTVRHLLTMTGGWPWTENVNGEYNAWRLSGDYVAFLLDREPVSVPGSAFVYNSAAVHLLSVVLEHAVGRPIDEFADDVLFGPLGITTRVWEILADGRPNGGAGIDLLPRDLARLGQLFLQEGRSGGIPVVPPSWVAASTGARFADLGSVGPIEHLSYGYLWWVDLDHDAYFAWGYGGQFIYVVPALELVVVSTNRWQGISQDGGPGPLQAAVLDIIVNDVLGAVR